MAKTITHDKNLNAFWGQEDHLKVVQERSFSEMIFELLSEKRPTPEQLKVFELILNLSIDHGPETPSAVKVIEEAQKGETISEAVSEGIEEINDSHGGAIEPCMELLYQVQNSKLKVQSLVEGYLKDGKRMAGFGHRIYTVDPRAQLILNKLQNFSSTDSPQRGVEKYIAITQDIEKELEAQKGKHIPLNIDGAIAVVLCTWGWEPKLGKAVFIIARTPGLCGQYLNHTN